MALTAVVAVATAAALPSQAALWMGAAVAVALYEWRRVQPLVQLQCRQSGWYYQCSAERPAQPVVLAQQQWIYGPLLLLSLRLPGRYWPTVLWVTPGGMAAGEFRRLCKALLVGRN